jgi:shikimate 5-dehydrogenase
MIVLVNERQVEALEIAEQREDRYEREYEGLINTTPLAGVPEPEEWLLIGAGGTGPACIFTGIGLCG